VADDAETDDEIDDPGVDTLGHKIGPRASRSKSNMLARAERMALFVVDERRREPLVPYDQLTMRVRTSFNVSRNTAQRAITAGQDIIARDWSKFCADAPRAIFDGYMLLHQEHMSRAAMSQRERDRVTHLANARRNLDSVRDMFGMTSTFQVINNGPVLIAAAALEPMSDEQLLALDALDGHKFLDVPTVAQSVELAGVAMDEIESNGHNGSNGANGASDDDEADDEVT
jgi:hypothetical protein